MPKSSARRARRSSARPRDPEIQRGLLGVPLDSRDPLARFYDRVDLSTVEDLRRFSPQPLLRNLSGTPARVHRQKFGSRPINVFSVPSTIAFSEPHKVILCHRRHTRKEVLHAKGVAGSKNLRPPRRNKHSNTSCKG